MYNQGDLLNYLVEIGLNRKWHLIEAKWGKSGTSSLLAHSLTVAGVTESLMDMIGDFNQSDKKIGIAASFFHDMLKESSSSHEAVEKEERLLDKIFSQNVKREIEEILKGAHLEDSEIKQVLSILPHGALQGVEHLTILLKGKEHVDNPRVRRLVHEVSDILASKKRIDDFSRIGSLEVSLSDFGLKLRYHRVSVIRGVVTSILHKTVHEIYESAGFRPILFYPEGTVYIGKDSCGEPDFSSFKEHYLDNLRRFLDGVTEIRPLGEQAIGRVNATAVNIPEFAYLSDNTLCEFWDAARNQNAIKNPNLSGYGKLELPEQNELEKEVFEDWLKERVGLYYLFIYLKAVIEHATNDWNDEEAVKTLNDVADNELGQLRDKFLKAVKNLSHTKSKKEKVEKGTFFRSIFSQDLSRDEGLDAATEFCKVVTKEVRVFADQHYGLKSLNIADQIINEVSYPPVGSVEQIVDEVWEDYNLGKERGTPLCVLCGRKASGDAVASLLGKAQTFTNFLRGGSRIAVGNKLRVCGLCDMEMGLRTLYTRNAEFEEYYLVPQINLSPSNARWWSDIAGELVTGHKRFGIDPVTRDLTWAKLVSDETTAISTPFSTLQNYTSKLLDTLWKSERNDLAKSIKDAITTRIEEEYLGSFEAFIEDNNLNANSIDEIVEAALSGDSNIIEIAGKELESFNKSKIRNLLAMVTPNYILISYPLRRSESEDHRASNYLRHLFRGTILSRLFMASVIVKELRYEPMVDVIPHGAVKIPTNLQFDRVFKNLGINLENGWLKLSDIDKALIKLSALLLLAEEIRGYSGGRSRRGELTTILNDYPGRTLNRLQQLSTENRTPNLRIALQLLNKIFSEEVKV